MARQFQGRDQAGRPGADDPDGEALRVAWLRRQPGIVYLVPVVDRRAWFSRWVMQALQ